MQLMLRFFQKSGCFRMLMVKVGGWVRIFELLTDAYAGGGDGCVGMVELLAYVIC